MKLGEDVDAIDEDVETDQEDTDPAVVGATIRMDSGSSDSSSDDEDEATARAEEKALFTTNKFQRITVEDLLNGLACSV